MTANRTRTSTVLEIGYSYTTPVMKLEDSGSCQDPGTDATESLRVTTLVCQQSRFTFLEKMPLKYTRRESNPVQMGC